MTTSKQPRKSYYYDVRVTNGPLLTNLTEEAVIEKCRRREITSTAMVSKFSTWGWITARYFEPIANLPEFVSYVFDLTPVKAELNPPQGMECYLLVDGEQRGPFLPIQILSMWTNGRITADTLYWFDGLKEWSPVKDFCQNTNMRENESNEPVLLKQLVAEQKKTSSQLWAIRCVLLGVFVIPFVLYQCSHTR